MDLIVRVFRVIASPPRMVILTYLVRRGEVTPTVLARELGVPPNSLSTNLKLLSTVGLIQGRKSGAQCYYAAKSPYGEMTLSGSLSRWLAGLLQRPRAEQEHGGLLEVRHVPISDDDERLHRIIFDAATAFTDLRRLQILRYLTTHAQATADELENKLSMSPHAVGRQTAKLCRRGFITSSEPDGQTEVFRLAREFKTPIHQRMFEIVRACWE